jgi:hypothetical protein
MLIHLIVTALLAQSNPPSDPKCKLEGRVVSATTGAPLKHANLRLQPVFVGGAPATRTSFSSSTDAEGTFVLQDVDPGVYTLRTERAGYVAQNYGARSASMGGTRLKLDAGQSMKDLLIKLVPQAMFFGKVIEDDGEPVPSARIQVQRWMFLNGKKQLQPTGSGTSQADGTFVIGNLAAGRYFISAELSRNTNFGETFRTPSTHHPRHRSKSVPEQNSAVLRFTCAAAGCMKFAVTSKSPPPAPPRTTSIS